MFETLSLETRDLQRGGTDLQFLLNTSVGQLIGDKTEGKEAKAGY